GICRSCLNEWRFPDFFTAQIHGTAIPTASEFRTTVRDATRFWFTEIREKHPNEKFYAFALYTDDDAITVCDAANTEEALRRQLTWSGARYPDISESYHRWT